MDTATDECFSTNLSLEDGQELNAIVNSLLDNAAQLDTATAAYSRFSHILSKYQEQPQLLDPLLETLIPPLANTLLTLIPPDSNDTSTFISICSLSRFLWSLSTVRGYKTILRFMPNEVAALEPAVRLLQLFTASSSSDANKGIEQEGEWEGRYVALMWLSLLVLIPFDLALIDSSLTNTSSSSNSSKSYPPIVGTLLEECKKQLSSPAATREMAAVLIGRLITRPDMSGALSEFVDWGCESLSSSAIDGTHDAVHAVFAIPGITLAFATAFKLGQREALLPAALKVQPAAVELIKSKMAAGNALIRKLAAKLIQRSALIFLPPRVASWRYSRGQRTFLTTSASNDGDNTINNSTKEQEEEPTNESDAWESDADMAAAVETSIGELLSSLADRDTVVRWSAAKGLGRIVERLQRDLGDEVVGAVIESFSSPLAGDAAWHGGCLALAELTRRGLLLPERLNDAVPIVIKALEYDVRRGPCSIGSHVRDGGAFVCWAFARAYSKDALGEAVTKLAPALITLACYDREVNCRRAAAAAFQECVGRLGSFPYGIDIITTADYFTVSSKNNAYLVVAPDVAKYKGYLEPLAWHLLRVKLSHWEKSTRELAAKALAALVPLQPSLFASRVVIDEYLLPLCCNTSLETRHGAVAFIAELLPALQQQTVELSSETREAIADVIPSIHAKKLSKGKGGEIMRSALCRLAETTSTTGISLTPEQHQSMHSTIMDNLQHSSPDVQQGAALALSAYVTQYLTTPDKCTELIDDLLKELTTAPVATTRRGAALALGLLPGWCSSPHVHRILSVLASTSTAIASDIDDAETRVNAVRAIASVLTAVYSGSHATADELVQIDSKVLSALLRALEDYSTDNRGDIGSWVREAAMDSLTRIFSLFHSLHSDGVLPSTLHNTAEKAMYVFLKQSVERIGRVREAAGTRLRVLAPLLASNNTSNEAILDIVTNQIKTSEEFMGIQALPRLATLLKYDVLRPYLLEGFAFSAGGLDAQLSEAATNAIVDALMTLNEVEVAGVAEALLLVWTRHTRSGRMCTPLLLLADALMSRTAIGELVPPESDFAPRLFTIIKGEVDGCTDIPRLRAASGVICQLAGTIISDDLREQALVSALGLLGNRYPKVRRCTAEQLYTMLLGCDPDEAPASWDIDGAMELLESTAWDGVAEAVRPARLQLFALFGLEPPAQLIAAVEKASSFEVPVSVVVDEHASYGALLQSQVRGF